VVFTDQSTRLENIGVNSQKSDNIKNPSKELKRINWDVAIRILKTLYLYGNQKRTVMARLTNMSYDRCVSYIGWLELLGFVKREADGKFEMIGLTDLGINFYKTKLMKASSISNPRNLYA